jgi:ubiquinol-cytochrome c reductase cytochrome b subunit
MKKILDWLDNRTGYKDLLHEALYERVPGGARWRYVWGSTLIFTFMLQMITGIFLWTAYSPSAQTAWESVYYIQEVMFMGNIVRGMHHFAAQAMVVLLAIHLIQVIIDGAYRAPREVNFWLGLVLMQIVLGLSLTGYLLPWDQKGYYATQVSTKIMGATPVIGPMLQNLVQGGSSYGHHTLTRFFAMHAGILPGLLIGFLVLHIWVFRRHGIHAPEPDKKPDCTFWPDQVLKDAVACLGVLAVVLLLAIFKGAELSAPANPAESYSAARPEWYFLFLFRFLKFEWVEHYGIAFGAIYIPGIFMMILTLMPIIALKKAGHKFNVWFTWTMVVGIFGLTALAMYEDNTNEDHQFAIESAERDAARVKELAKGPSKIPVEGAVSLLKKDPFSQGPRLFAKHCASCHRHDGHDGTGRLVIDLVPGEDGEEGTTVTALPTAPDLHGFGTKKWVRGIVTDYRNHVRYIRQGADKKFVESILKEGTMYQWAAENEKVFADPKNKESIDALVEFLAAQSGREKLEDLDADLMKKGRTIFTTGTLAAGEFSSSCADCHQLIPRGETKALEETDLESAPILTGYGGPKWLRGMIESSNAIEYYGYGNTEEAPSGSGMPDFKGRLNKDELKLLINWMMKNYYETKIEDHESKLDELEEAVKERGVKPEPAKTEPEETDGGPPGGGRASRGGG